MSGPGQKKRQVGISIPVPEIDVIRGVQGTMGSVRQGLDNTFNNLDPFRAANRVIGGAQDLGDAVSNLASSPNVASAIEKDKKAVDLGFASEADRIAKVSKIIDSFGKRSSKAPLALAGKNKSTPGIMV